MDSKKTPGTDPIDIVDVLDTRQNNDSDSELQKDIYDDDTVDPVYRAKAHILNEAIQEIGMGRYQVCDHAFVNEQP